jgi:hypothetical protein
MRNYMVIFLSLFIGIPSISQVTYQKGYIVKSAGDTVRGSLKADIEEKLRFGVYFKKEGGEDNFFDTTALKAFGFEDGNIYRAVKFRHPLKDSTTVTRFAKSLVKGSYQLLTYMESGERLFLVITPEGAVHFMYNSARPVYKDFNAKEYFVNNFENKLVFLSVGCPALQNKTNQVAFLEKDMVRFFSSLNTCLYPGTSSVITYKKAKQKIVPIIFAGGLPLGDKTEITGQFILRFLLPSVSRKTSLNTGIYYLWHQEVEKYGIFSPTATITTSIISIPLVIQQNFTEGIVQPYVYAGAGFDIVNETDRPYYATKAGIDRKFGLSLVGGAGIEVLIGKHLMAKTEARYDLIFHYPVIGLAYKFK